MVATQLPPPNRPPTRPHVPARHPASSAAAATVARSLASHASALAMLAMAALLGVAEANAMEPPGRELSRFETSPWRDVCTAEEYRKYRKELCEDVFFVSSLYFSPWYPLAKNAYITLFIQAQRTMISTPQQRLRVHMKLPGFEPVGTFNQYNALFIDLPLQGRNPPGIGEKPNTAYNTIENSIFETFGTYDTVQAEFILPIRDRAELKGGVDTEVRICCVNLPAESVKDNTDFTIRMAGKVGTDTSEEAVIPEEFVMRTPLLDFGLQWDNARVLFDPPLSQQLVSIRLSVRPAATLRDGTRVVLHLPHIFRQTGTMVFDTAGTDDWLLFLFNAFWDNDKKILTFFMKPGRIWPANHGLTLRTLTKDFLLPLDIPAFDPEIQVEARSADDIDTLIRPKRVSQNSRVFPIRSFNFSKLEYTVERPGATTDVTLTFKTNRPMFAGSSVYVRLSGFQSQVVEILVEGANALHFRKPIGLPRAHFDGPSNVLTLTTNKTIYSQQRAFTIVIKNMILPAALYENDPSLRIWTDDVGAVSQAIDESPMVGGGMKFFIRSQALFSPAQPRYPANITFIILPSVVLYQDDRIQLHLYGFRYPQPKVPLEGPGAVAVGGFGLWYPDDAMLLLTVAKNEVIDNVNTLFITVPISAGMRLPGLLSKNDGQLRIQAEGNVIRREPFKKTPKIGPKKEVLKSRLTIEEINGDTQLSLKVVRLVIEWVLNCDAIPNSTVQVTLGGMVRQIPGLADVDKNRHLQSGTVALWGKNAPLFNDFGYWDASKFLLTLQTNKDVTIFSGEKTRFYIEVDQYFRTPFAMYGNDPSFTLAIPEAGIRDTRFNYTTKVNDVAKGFAFSELCYGSCSASAIEYPGTVADFYLKFTPNVDLPEGSLIRVKLPGFRCPYERISLTPQERPMKGEADLAFFIDYAIWNQDRHTFDLIVPEGKTIFRRHINILRVLKGRPDALMLPRTELFPNDARLTIQCMSNQIIYEEPIKTSPRVVERDFKISKLTYTPQMAQQIFQLNMEIQPTVNVTDRQNIVLFLPGFENINQAKYNIHVLGRDRNRIMDSMAQWNQSSYQLTLKVPEDAPIEAFTKLQLYIQESQGFYLPKNLKANDTRITITSKNNIPAQPVKLSPMVGDGPFSRHMICMMQYERGVRTVQTLCDRAELCRPRLLDPCNDAELLRCGCQSSEKDPVDLSLRGFEMLPTDRMIFLPFEQLCGAPDAAALSPFSPPSKVNVSAGQDMITYANISSIQSGKFRMCVLHRQLMYDAGFIIVRPSCRAPLVFVDGACVRDCPATRKPVSGNCVADPVAKEEKWRLQTLMLPVLFTGGMAHPEIAARKSYDPLRKYFEYVFKFDLAGLLNADPSRIRIVDMSAHNGTGLVVSTIFENIDISAVESATTLERSPMALISLFRALVEDGSSSLYSSSLFKEIGRDYVSKRTPLEVVPCPKEGSGVYAPFCPYRQEGLNSTGTGFWFICGNILLVLFVAGICFFAWRIDSDSKMPYDEDMFDDIWTNPGSIMPEMRQEFAESWLEGRYPGEFWQNSRSKQLFVLHN